MRHRRPGALQTLSPLRILTQILLLQTLHYATAFALILFTALAAGKPFSLDLVLSWRSLRGDTTIGWTLGLCWVMCAGAGYVISSPPGLPYYYYSPSTRSWMDLYMTSQNQCFKRPS